MFRAMARHRCAGCWHSPQFSEAEETADLRNPSSPSSLVLVGLLPAWIRRIRALMPSFHRNLSPVRPSRTGHAGLGRQRGRRYYAVIYEGRDPLSGRERRRWHAAGSDRAGAEELARRLAEGHAGDRPPRGSLTVAVYLTQRWLPSKRLALGLNVSSEKQDAWHTCKKGYGFSPIGSWCDTTAEPLAAMLDRETPARTTPTITSSCWTRRS